MTDGKRLIPIIAPMFYKSAENDLISRIFRSQPCADPEGGQGVRTPPPLKNHKNIGFLSNSGPDPPKNHEATEPAFNVKPLSERQQNAIYMALRWRADRARLYWYFYPSTPHHLKKASPLTKFSGSAHVNSSKSTMSKYEQLFDR